ncbi:MAG TPA: PKD domain-containing protein [bacterium]|nr:PKD domain-containing protein [bacterium]
MRKALLLFLIFLPLSVLSQPVVINYPSDYYFKHIEVGDSYYTDRDYQVTSIPIELDRYLWLRTSADDKYSSSNYFISFTLREPMTVYIGYDSRSYQIPNWLSSQFTLTPMRIAVSDVARNLVVWKKDFPAGTHILGGNLAAGGGDSRTMYIVIFSTKKAEIPTIESPLDGATNVSAQLTRFTWKKADAAIWYYIKISTKKSSSGVFYSEYSITDTTHTVSLLQPYQTYYWCVEGSNETSKSGFTPWASFSTVPGEPPQAAFSANPTQGAAPLEVNFINQSSGMYTTIHWNFGDGQSSNLSNPTHIYSSPGVYTVTLSLSGDNGSDQLFKNDLVRVAQKPTADFITSPLSGFAPLQVIFLDRSSGEIDHYHWDFGDGSNSTEQNPVHTFQNSGSYTVSLQVSGIGGSDQKTVPDYITCQTQPTAQFSASPLSGMAPLRVTFSNLSQGDYDTQSWNFGDGYASTEANPLHEYTQAGLYTVSLSLNGTAGNDVEIKNGYITVSAPPVYEPPVALFSAIPLSGQEPLTVQFQNQSTGDSLHYTWDFGDGATSTAVNPAHIYSDAGEYSVSLIATGPVASDTFIQEKYIQVFPAAANYVTVSLPDCTVSLTPPQQKQISIPITVSDVTDLGIISYQFEVEFDDSVISPNNVNVVNTLSTIFSMPLLNTQEKGKLKVGNFGTTPLYGEGVLIYLIFDVIGQIGSTTELTLSSFEFNAGDPQTIIVNGSIDIITDVISENFDGSIHCSALSDGYPNPFNSSIRFDLSIARTEQLRVVVVDRLGRTVRELATGLFQPGEYRILWDGNNQEGIPAPSGIYFIRSSLNHSFQVRKVIYVK